MSGLKQYKMLHSRDNFGTQKQERIMDFPEELLTCYHNITYLHKNMFNHNTKLRMIFYVFCFRYGS